MRGAATISTNSGVQNDFDEWANDMRPVEGRIVRRSERLGQTVSVHNILCGHFGERTESHSADAGTAACNLAFRGSSSLMRLSGVAGDVREHVAQNASHREKAPPGKIEPLA